MSRFEKVATRVFVVVALIFFVIVTIGFGFYTYYMITTTL